MTQKELAYIEDAIGHESNIIKILEQTNERIEDERLKNFLQTELSEHTKMKEQLIRKLEEKSNEWSIING